MSVQFVVDSEGQKTGVFLSYDEYVELLELAEDVIKRITSVLKNLQEDTFPAGSSVDGASLLNTPSIPAFIPLR